MDWKVTGHLKDKEEEFSEVFDSEEEARVWIYALRTRYEAHTIILSYTGGTKEEQP